jgi:hypothetical protein
MLSFEISAVDVVLMIAMLVLFALFVTRGKNQPTAALRQGIDHQKGMSEETEMGEKTFAEGSFSRQPADGFRGCVHQFGFLRSMPENTAVPAECFGCPEVLRCMFKNG